MSQQSPKSDSSKNSLSDNFKAKAKELMIIELNKEIDKLRNELDDSKKEIERLQLLVNKTSSSVITFDNITPEERIIIEQLRILENRAIQKELTLEEIKKYDLLVKNKKIISGKDQDQNNDSLKNVSEDNLLELAKTKVNG